MSAITLSLGACEAGLFLDEQPLLRDRDEILARALNKVRQTVPPVWPLADYVAVNPCVGLSELRFLEANGLLSNVRDCSLLMPLEYFRQQYAAGKLAADDLAAALQQCVAEYPEWYSEWDLTELQLWLTEDRGFAEQGLLRYRTVAEAVDQRLGSTWSSHIVNDVTRHCGAHYDEGQALWPSPWKDATLFEAWREAVLHSQRMDMLGLSLLRPLVAKLPRNPVQAIKKLLLALNVPSSQWETFLLCEVFSVAGWASYIRYRVRESEQAGEINNDLIGLLALRLAYDVALAQAPGIPWPLLMWPADAERIDDGEYTEAPKPTDELLARYALQRATETVYRRSLLNKLGRQKSQSRQSERKTLQMVFCIDVRSEVLRRHLETTHDSIETFGFAGFFGVPVEFVQLGAERGTPQCPVLLQPTFQVHETLRTDNSATQNQVIENRLALRQARKNWKRFQTSATSCFSFVEALGLPYLAKLLTDSLQWTRPVNPAAADGLSSDQRSQIGPDLHSPWNTGLDPNRQIELTAGILRNLGLTSGFARVVVFCGHESEVVNNPYRAALDCGACGGHSGKPNARIAAALLNDPAVRAGLRAREIVIPHDTWFVAAVHNTTREEVSFCDSHIVPESHTEEMQQIQEWCRQAGRLSRIERSGRLGAASADDVLRRSRDWAEVRPEWGLAGNAAFVVASRARTAGLELGGRVFLHSYEQAHDTELKVLELIMTAPMIVTNWINMQYYASTVDPKAFGAGNKLIHNVVGQFGVLEGNAGDLQAGLPWQSVHDGSRWQHEPLRLLVVIDAPRTSLQTVIDAHPLVRDLVTHGWIDLVAWEGNQFFGFTAQGEWERQSL